MNLFLKLLVPYFTVGICWCVFKNGWLAILAYHALILFWRQPRLNAGKSNVKSQPTSPALKILDLKTFDPWAALPTLLAGPLLYFILPIVSHTELGIWLAEYKLTGGSLLLMIPYFGIIHPLMEQLHWAPLREQTPAAHLLFAGYHMMVLVSLLKTPWLIACFVLLTITSILWQQLTRKSNSLAPAILSHILADLGIILTAWFIIHN